MGRSSVAKTPRGHTAVHAGRTVRARKTAGYSVRVRRTAIRKKATATKSPRLLDWRHTVMRAAPSATTWSTIDNATISRATGSCRYSGSRCKARQGRWASAALRQAPTRARDVPPRMGVAETGVRDRTAAPGRGGEAPIQNASGTTGVRWTGRPEKACPSLREFHQRHAWQASCLVHHRAELCPWGRPRRRGSALQAARRTGGRSPGMGAFRGRSAAERGTTCLQDAAASGGIQLICKSLYTCDKSYTVLYKNQRIAWRDLKVGVRLQKRSFW